MEAQTTQVRTSPADRACLLLVDDEPLNLEILVEHLDDSRYATVQACNGAEAWQLLDADPAGFDLVLLDRMMPVMNGMELLAKVRADSRFTALPVVMQSAAAAKDQVAEGLRQGAHYYLTKPFEREVLLAIVESALDHRRNRVALVDDHPDPRSVVSAEFEFHTLPEVRRLAGFLAGTCPEPGQVVLGLTELMINAIEHGNLGITYREKSDLNERGVWREEVERRLSQPEYAGRRARIKVARGDDGVTFVIEDEGGGFDWQRYLEMEPERAFDSHGRGIAMSRMVSFAALEYRGRGNVVCATVAPRRVD